MDKNIESLYNLATHDEKTGLYNYRFFQEIFGIEFEKAKRGQNLSIVIFDIDNFKMINSKFGHINADKILIKVAKIIKNILRKYDVVARFGGEEFIVMLPSTNLIKAKKVSERIRISIEKDFKKEKVTISGGIAEYKKGDTKEKLKNRADKFLFKAKSNGKNRIEF
ncbi:MAG: GGDEF domain-containing protein [Flavobacterium sp.]|uniref:GGDEF domain-containing protein n=1 Tax=Flavobacterium sp. TaxID=239 RepID=UPI00262A4299|nr:GGDEF domain-containing protein [Flavobacterium sp.]MDD5151258.1 GGDEF domain-containing protein [Flavobacterium sp.]